VSPASGIAPHLGKLMREYAATGMPPAFIPLEPRNEDDDTHE
jgi:hypothetical protein